MILQRIAQNSLASLPGKGYASSLFRAMQTIITIAVYPLMGWSSSKINHLVPPKIGSRTFSSSKVHSRGDPCAGTSDAWNDMDTETMSGFSGSPTACGSGIFTPCPLSLHIDRVLLFNRVSFHHLVCRTRAVAAYRSCGGLSTRLPCVADPLTNYQSCQYGRRNQKHQVKRNDYII